MRVRETARGKAGPAPINLSFTLRNFGPVAHGDISIKPLTVLIGPNNSGKSYVATLLRSILAAQSQVTGPRLGPNHAAAACRDMLQKKYKQNKYKMAVTKLESKKILGILLDEDLGPALERQIVRDFGSNIRDLVRTGKNSASVEVSERDPGSGETRRLAIKLGGKLSARTAVKPTGYVVEAGPGCRHYHVNTDERPRHRNDEERHAEEARHMSRDRPNPYEAAAGADPDALCTACATDITGAISGQFQFKTAPRATYYFPAVRSGILQGYKALSAGIVAFAPYGGIEPIETPPVTGVAGDFISQITLLSRAEGPFAAMARDMENELLGGNIVLSAAARGAHPEIAYRSNGGTVPLHRSSSTISEIAPLSLYLKHIVNKGSFLIIEEPEEHLHPASQLVLAKYLVRLVRGGIGILATTHSSFLLEKLAKYMMAGTLSPEQRSADLGYGRDDFLMQGEVSAHLFERRPDGGHRIKPVERDEEYGISQEEFVRVSEALHRETIIINSKMRAPGKA